jgi:hypothetical protein
MALLFVPYFEGGLKINQEDILPILSKNDKNDMTVRGNATVIIPL